MCLKADGLMMSNAVANLIYVIQLVKYMSIIYLQTR